MVCILSFHLLPEHQFLFAKKPMVTRTIVTFPSPSGASILIPILEMNTTEKIYEGFHLIPEHQFLFAKKPMVTRTIVTFPSPSGASILIPQLTAYCRILSTGFPSPSGTSILILYLERTRMTKSYCFHLLPEHQFLFKRMVTRSINEVKFSSPSGASILIPLIRIKEGEKR